MVRYGMVCMYGIHGTSTLLLAKAKAKAKARARANSQLRLFPSSLPEGGKGGGSSKQPPYNIPTSAPHPLPLYSVELP